MRPGSTIAAARAVGRSSAGSSARSPYGSAPSVAAVAGCGPGHRVEVEPELQLAAGGSRGGPAGAPALGPARDPGGRHVPAVDHATQALRALLGQFAGHRRETLDQRPELVLAEQPHDGVAVVVAEPRRLEVQLDRQVADDARELAAHLDLVEVLAQLVAELLRRDLVDPGEHVIEAAELADELGRGLLADPRDARDVVGGVALERLVVDHLVGPQAEPLVDPGDVVHDGVLDAGTGGHQPHPRRHQLEHVEVDGDDRRLEVLVAFELLGDRPDDVVGLEARHLVDRDPQRLDDLADLRELVAQVVRHALAGRLVLGVLLVPERGTREVERDREVVRLEVLEAAQDDAREAEHAVDELAPGRRQRRQRVVAAVDEPVAVEQHQAFHGLASGWRRGGRRQMRARPGRRPQIVPAQALSGRRSGPGQGGGEQASERTGGA